MAGGVLRSVFLGVLVFVLGEGVVKWNKPSFGSGNIRR